MLWSYENYLQNQLATLVNDLGLDVEVVVCEEQMFLKIKEYFPKTIYCVVKYLATTIQYSSTIRPVQITVMSEANQLTNAKILFDTLANNYNWTTIIYGTTYIKQQYSSPVVLSNFNDVSYTFRSVLYVSTTIIEMEDVVDVKDSLFKISFIDTSGVEPATYTDIEVKAISQQIQYIASGDTQPVGNFRISETIKSVSTFSLTLIVPPKNNAFITQCTKIMKGDISGNERFTVKFTLGDINMQFNMILTAYSHNSAVNEIPGISIGLMR